MAYFDPIETFGRMWRAMGKNIDWANGPEGQKLLQRIKAKGSAPSFGTGNLYSDFQNDLMTGGNKVRDQVAQMYKNYYGTGTTPTPTARTQAVSKAQTRAKGGPIVKSPGGAIVDQTQRITTNQNVSTPTGPRGTRPRLPGNPPLQGPGPAPQPVTPKAQAVAKGSKFGLGKLIGGALTGLGIYDGVQNIRQGNYGLGATEIAAAVASPVQLLTAGAGILLTATPTSKNDTISANEQQLTPEQKKVRDQLASQRPQVPESVTDPVTVDPTPKPDADTPAETPKRDVPKILIPLTDDQGNVKPGQTPATDSAPTVRRNGNGIVQKGKSLSGANATLANLGLGPLQDAGRFFDPQYSPSTSQSNIETGTSKGKKDMDFSVEDAVTMGMDRATAERIKAGGSRETLITGEGPMITGQNTDDPTTGVSDKPDVAEGLSRIQLATSGIKADPRFMSGGARRAAKAAFLDPANQGYNAIRARDAAVGISQDGVLLNGEFREWAGDMDADTKRRARFAATGSGFATKESQQKWAELFLKRAEAAKPDVPDASNTGAPTITPTTQTPQAPATPQAPETPATPKGQRKIGDIRISNADYQKMVGPIGDYVPEVKGLGVESTYDPVTKMWRILRTTDSQGNEKVYN